VLPREIGERPRPNRPLEVAVQLDLRDAAQELVVSRHASSLLMQTSKAAVRTRVILSRSAAGGIPVAATHANELATRSRTSIRH
jgi:hypothetical protein